jgi:transposase-like protein
MSKIPQGEWNAIAARYAQGESISRIAQSYGCTPPAIHYILKRYKQRTGKNSEPPKETPLPQTVVAQEVIQAPTPPKSVMQPLRGEEQPTRAPTVSIAGTEGFPRVGQQATHRAQAEPFRPSEHGRSAPLRQHPGTSKPRGFPAGLDSELHGRAEAAIEAFRLSFDAALAESSPAIRQKLREAAADLMRVAARTTIVLDQLNARSEH